MNIAKFFKFTFLFAFSFSLSSNLNAATFYSLANGASQNITEHGVCRVVTNTTGQTVFIPTNTAAEWTAFYSTTYPGLAFGTYSGCTTTTTQTPVDGGTCTTPVDCNRVTFKVWGAGGGGGGGGNGANASTRRGAGGGGGSSWYDSTLVLSGSHTAGSGTTPGNSGDADRGTAGNGGAGGGTSANGTSGNPGKVVCSFFKI